MEQKPVKKRQRSENWLEEDKCLLMDLVRERVKDIENKNTDTNTNSKKVSAWADLTESFNSMCKGSRRTIQQLKNQWSVAKMTRKKSLALERRMTVKTGGGPPPDRPPQDSDDIAAWLPAEFTVDSNEFDSDQILDVKKFKPDTIDICADTPRKPVEVADSVEIILNSDEEDNDQPEKPKEKAKEINADNLYQTEKPLKANTYKKPAKKTQKEKQSTSDGSKVIDNEIACRRELHNLQMENEMKKSRILDLEAKLLGKKIEYYDKLMTVKNPGDHCKSLHPAIVSNSE